MLIKQYFREHDTENIMHSLLFNLGNLSRISDSLAHTFTNIPWQLTTLWIPSLSPLFKGDWDSEGRRWLSRFAQPVCGRAGFVHRHPTVEWCFEFLLGANPWPECWGLVMRKAWMLILGMLCNPSRRTSKMESWKTPCKLSGQTPFYHR